MRFLSPSPVSIPSRPDGRRPWPVPTRSGPVPARLRELLVRVARGEVARRGPRLQMTTRNHELVVFRMTDRPVHDAFGLYRAEATDAVPGPADPSVPATGR